MFPGWQVLSDPCASEGWLAAVTGAPASEPQLYNRGLVLEHPLLRMKDPVDSCKYLKQNNQSRPPDFIVWVLVGPGGGAGRPCHRNAI